MPDRPSDRRESPPRPSDLQSATRRLVWAIIGAVAFTVVLLIFDLI
jgi:hypothetical protein